MPNETKDAIKWALSQKYDDGTGYQYAVTVNTVQQLVDKVREFFNINDIEYNSFDFYDLKEFL